VALVVTSLEQWSALGRQLQQLDQLGAPLRYVPNEGNAGDALITAGTWQLFEDLGIQPRYARIGQIRRGDVALFGGGGNLVPEYVYCKKFLERCLRVGVRAALVLPQSVRGHERLLGRLDERFTIVCREHESLSRCRSAIGRARVELSPDLGLRVDVARLRARCGTAAAHARLLRALVRRGQLADYWHWRRALRPLRGGRAGVLRVLRADVEAVDHARGPAALDVSGLYGSMFRSRTEAEFVARDLLALLSTVDTVVTNRLHVGIGAALVGCRVTLLDNSYGKLRAVYESSLRDEPTIRFTSQLPSDPAGPDQTGTTPGS
jgi:exopolysaccharide biosynthesis predicted pyruvyltransferase EpsI